MLLLAACKKDPEVGIEQFRIVGEELSVGTSSATLTGTYDCPIAIKGLAACVTEGGNAVGEYAAELNGKAFSIGMTGLRPSTTYTYYYKVDYGATEPYVTESKTFTTLDVAVLDEMPMARTLEVLAIDSTTCRVKCEVVSEGGSPVTEQGICWNTTGNPSVADATLQCDSTGLGTYTVYMERLSPGKQYYVRAYARNAMGVGLGNVMNFEMSALPGMPVDIHVSCMPEDGGVAIGGGTYEAGTTCTVVAGAAAGYTFVNWTENGNQVSAETSYTFPVTVERNLVANFSADAYIISVGIVPEEGGTATGAGGYAYGDTCTLVTTPNMGYDFVKWTRGGNTVSTEAEYSFAVKESATYTAHFQVKSYSIAVAANPAEGGSVSGGGSLHYGESCTVHAVPAEGYAFANWIDEGDVVSTEADYTFTVTGNRSLKANFTELQPNEYTINVSANPTEGGTVTGGGTYQEGQSCTVNATAKPGFAFVNWTENGEQVNGLSEYTFTVTRNRTLTANFEVQAPTEYTVNATANPEEGGTVTGGGTYEQGQQCTVRATANEGFTFTNWTENSEVVSTHANWTFIVNADRTLTANFTKMSYTITAMAHPNTGGTVSGDGSYDHGQSCTLIATAANGYKFMYWTENGQQVSTNANYTFTVTQDRTLVANFAEQAPNNYTINVSPNPSNGGTVTGGGTYQQGQTCTLTATPATGYTFLRWTENGTQVSTNANYTFTVTGNRTLVAQFQANSYTITATANPSNGGTATGGGAYNHGQSCTLHATPATGYTFLRWTENGTQVSTNANYTFTVTGNRTLVAQFQANSYTITATANPSNGGTATGGGAYNHGQSCTVTATANYGFVFANWTENGAQVSVNASYTFQVTGNRSLVANFIALQAPTGAINGLFSVSDNQQVWFSQGNLQYKASTNTWRFATNQYDYIGEGNANISQTYNGWIDLFGWGTSGWDSGNIYYHPWDSDYSDNTLYGPSPETCSLVGEYANADWGVYNSISNGGNQANQWRSLTYWECNYLLDTRVTSSGVRFAKAQVNGINGLILVPDNWSNSVYGLQSVNTPTSPFESNVISLSVWQNVLEANGSVFLPAAGSRYYGTSIYWINERGNYWLSTGNTNEGCASTAYINSDALSTGAGYRSNGLAVRLVRNVQ